jgi:septal ring factor EnvC (AmiA/AmiB activator)
MLMQVSLEERDIIDMVRSAQRSDVDRLEQEISEERQEACRLRTECRRLWAQISELMVALEENNIEIPIFPIV